MKKSLSNRFLVFFMFFSVFATSGLYAEFTNTTVEWNGTNNPDVTDKNIRITDNVILDIGCNIIRARQKNVLVRIDRDAQIRGNSSGPSRLNLLVAQGKTIRFLVDKDLDFIGSACGDPLLIIQNGGGTVEFAIEGGSEVSFTKKDGTAGTQYWLLMREPVVDEYGVPGDEYSVLPGDEYSILPGDEYSILPGDEYSTICDDEYSNCVLSKRMARGVLGDRTYEEPFDSEFLPTLCFVRDDNSENDQSKNVTIKIGKESLVSFLSTNTGLIDEDSACVKFNTANEGDGRMVLCIADRGGFIVAGHKTKEKTGVKITLDDIDRKTAAGHNAIWKIINPEGSPCHGGLLVLNKNKSLFELLFDPFCTLGTRSSSNKWRGTFSGIRWGCVLGANATLEVRDDAYLDYVGLALNKIPDIDMIPGFENVDPETLIKMRNPSAFFIDGNHNPSSRPAHIELLETSAAFFRSGVDNDGSVKGLKDEHQFTIEPLMRTPGAGNYVLIVEGQVDIHGPLVAGTERSKIELLSREVGFTGGSLFINTAETNFPARTFAKDANDEFFQYNCGAFLINNCMNLFDTALVHTDQCHRVFEKNDTRSEPSYVGGETFKLKEDDDVSRPKIAFYNAALDVHTNIAITGVDLVTPNLVEEAGICKVNRSAFIFYHNGFGVDNGTGRQMVLGTRVGSTAADGCTRIDCDAHLDVIQLYDCFDINFNPESQDNHRLTLSTAPNSTKIVEEVGDLNKNSIHTIFLGCDSNISIGVNKDTTGFDIDTNPWLLIEGNFFSFESRGGPLRRPETSNVTGKGGIFVDLNGRISIGPGFRSSMGMMITKSRDGLLELPKSQVYFPEGMAIADWRLDLRNLQVVVSAGTCLSDYTLNWIATRKDIENFCPIELGDVTICQCPEVTQKQVASLPTIQGEVDQLQIQGSRIGDEVHIMIDGGKVRELVFQKGNQSAEAPVAVVVLKNDGRVGVGSAHRSKDSLCASTTFGVNGLTIIADGKCRVDLNTNMEINNICAFLRGPNFVEGDKLEIAASVQHEIRVKPSGILDFRSFDAPGDEVEFCGDIRFCFEPGSQIILGGGTIRFADRATLIFPAATNVLEIFEAIPHGDHDDTLDPLATVDASAPHNEFASLTSFGEGLRNTDPFRVRIMGVGTIEMKDNTTALIPFDSFVGVESLSEGGCEITNTDIELRLLDSAKFFVGRSDVTEGGVFQVGNVEDFGSDHSVNFTLTLDGSDAEFSVGRLAFVGWGVGVERACAVAEDGEVALSELLIDTMNNVGTIKFNFFDGLFRHDRIFDTDDIQGSVMAINSDATFTVDFEEIGDDVAEQRTSNFNVAGGGNLVVVTPGAGSVHPIVRDDDNEVVVNPTTGDIDPRRRVSIFASSLLQDLDEDETGIDGNEFFDEFKTADAVLGGRTNSIGRANVAQAGENFRESRLQLRLVAVSNGTIVRTSISDIISVPGGTPSDNRNKASDLGAVFININPVTNDVLTATQIQ